MTSVEVVEATAEQARELTDRIKVAVEGTWQLVKQAYLSRAWAALGYASWDDYCTREFGTSRLRLPREERQEVVASLRDTGMSVRAIAAATGNSVGTIHSELRAGVQNRTPNLAPEPQKITGTDGKTYPQPAARPTAAPRPALPPQFQTAAHELTRVIGRFERLQGDDRYRANRTSIADQCLPEIRRAAEVLRALLSDLGHENGDLL